MVCHSKMNESMQQHIKIQTSVQLTVICFLGKEIIKIRRRSLLSSHHRPFQFRNRNCAKLPLKSSMYLLYRLMNHSSISHIFVVKC